LRLGEQPRARSPGTLISFNDHFSIGFYVIDGTGQAFLSSRYPAYTYLVSTLRYTDP